MELQTLLSPLDCRGVSNLVLAPTSLPSITSDLESLDNSVS